MTHGIYDYVCGCRCEDCRAANAGRAARNRARRRADEERLNHGSISSYGAGCRCEACREARRQQYVQHEGGYRENWWVVLVTDTYRAARAAWESQRESSEMTSAVAGTAGGVAMYQLSDAEYRDAYPAPTLGQVLSGFSQVCT